MPIEFKITVFYKPLQVLQRHVELRHVAFFFSNKPETVLKHVRSDSPGQHSPQSEAEI